MYKLEGMVSPDVMQDIDTLIDAAEKVEANLDMCTKQARGQNQEQPQNERPRGQGRGQANYVDRNRGDNRYRSTPYSTHGRGRGVTVIQPLRWYCDGIVTCSVQAECLKPRLTKGPERASPRGGEKPPMAESQKQQTLCGLWVTAWVTGGR